MVSAAHRVSSLDLDTAQPRVSQSSTRVILGKTLRDPRPSSTPHGRVVNNCRAVLSASDGYPGRLDMVDLYGVRSTAYRVDYCCSFHISGVLHEMVLKASLIIRRNHYPHHFLCNPMLALFHPVQTPFTLLDFTCNLFLPLSANSL